MKFVGDWDPRALAMAINIQHGLASENDRGAPTQEKQSWRAEEGIYKRWNAP